VHDAWTILSGALARSLSSLDVLCTHHTAHTQHAARRERKTKWDILMRERFGSTSLFMAGASRLLGKEEEKKEKQLDALSSLFC
jgi:hypothetical protein